MRLNYKKGQSSIRSKFLAIKLRPSLHLVAEKLVPILQPGTLYLANSLTDFTGN